MNKNIAWPREDWHVLSLKHPRNILAACQIIREKLPFSSSTKEDYFEFIKDLRNGLLGCSTIQSFSAALLDYQSRVKLEDLNLARSLCLNNRDLIKIERLLAAGWPHYNHLERRKGWKVIQTSSESWALLEGLKVINEGFKSEEAAWNWLDQSRSISPGKNEFEQHSDPYQWSYKEAGLMWLNQFGLRSLDSFNSLDKDLFESYTKEFVCLGEKLGSSRAVGINRNLSIEFSTDTTEKGVVVKNGQVQLGYEYKEGKALEAWARTFLIWAGRGESVCKSTVLYGVPSPNLNGMNSKLKEVWISLWSCLWGVEEDDLIYALEKTTYNNMDGALIQKDGNPIQAGGRFAQIMIYLAKKSGAHNIHPTRIFEVAFSDWVRSNSNRTNYLNRDDLVFPFPIGDEREKIDRSFTKLFSAYKPLLENGVDFSCIEDPPTKLQKQSEENFKFNL